MTARLKRWLVVRLLHCVLGVRSPHVTYICMASMARQVVVPDLAVYVYDFSMFVDAPTIQELFLVFFFKEKEEKIKNFRQFPERVYLCD